MKHLIILLFLLITFLLTNCTVENENILVDGCEFEAVAKCDNPDVQICDQIWMGCNLDVEFYRNGEPIKHCVTSADWEEAGENQEGAWCYYDNDSLNGLIYGKLYNWYAVSDPRGLAPVGWHIPTDEEWKELEMCLGMSQAEADEIGYRGTDQGSQLAGRADLWEDGILKNNANFGTSGFSALPSGVRVSHFLDENFLDFKNKGIELTFWTPFEINDSTALIRDLFFLYAGIRRTGLSKYKGMGVRCVRD